MSECRQIESLLAPFVDGEADRHRAHVIEAHLATCDDAGAHRASGTANAYGRDACRGPRCPFGMSNHTHLLYRSGDREVLLHVTPGGRPRTAVLHVLGHAEKLWSAGGNVYTLVTRGLDDAQAARVSAYLERETRVQ